MLFINNTARIFTIRERVEGKILRCDLVPGDNEITKPETISMLKGSFYFRELVKNKVMVVGVKKEVEEEDSIDKKKKKKKD
jgi:hypothetical protein